MDRTRVLGLLGVALVVSSCGSRGDGPATTPVPDPPAGHAYASSDRGTHPLVPGTGIRLSFTGDALTASAGCNTITGPARLADGRLVADRLVQTEMGCPGRLADQDSWLAGLLSARPRIDLDGAGGLTLTTQDDTVTFTEQDLTPLPLEGTDWSLDAVLSGTGPDATAASLPQGAAATLRVSDGRVLVGTGCNRGRATVAVSEGVLDLGPLALTRRACPPPLADLETAVTRVLVSGATYTVEGRVLTVTAPDGTAGLVYRAVSHRTE